MIRLVHVVVLCAFVAAAIYVYKIKFDSTVQAEHVAVIRAEIEFEEAAPPKAPQAPWHRRLAQGLLYGRNVDRAKKARARLGLAIVAFGLVYLVIAARLVLYAVAPDTHVVRRGGSGDAVAT